MVVREVELYVDTINDFVYDDYVAMCNREHRDVRSEKSKDFKNWNIDMKAVVLRLFLVRLGHSTIADNNVVVKAKNKETQEVQLKSFLLDKITNCPKIRFVREEKPDKLTLLTIDDDKKKTTYKMTFVDSSISYENIF